MPLPRPAPEPAAAAPTAAALTAHDVVIVGGGHNGLTAAAYLARAGLDVLLLERDDHLGGAAVSAEAFEGVDARLSRYSYLVSLLPQRIVDDLGLEIGLVRRRFSSYTPDPADPGRGLLVDGDAGPEASRAAFERVDAQADAAAWDAFYRSTARLAERLFPTLTEPLPTRAEARALVGDDDVWNAFVERPLGETIDATFASDLVRGVVATDGLIGTFTALDDPSLDANRCFLYHVIGGGTGDWDVPIGGMGAVSGELERAARTAGARLVTGAEVVAVDPTGRVRYRVDGGERVATAGTVLANVAPAVLERLVEAGDPDAAAVPPVVRARLHALHAPEGAQVKVNLLLERLPRLRDADVAAEQAFAGTFHINELATQLDAAFSTAVRGGIPSPLPCEIYCHTLSDPSILAPELAAAGMHTLTVFGLHVPHRLLERHGNAELRELLQQAVLDSLDSVLAEPVEGVIAKDASGRPCIETKTTLDLEESLRMPGGNIFHGPLSWPWADDGAPLATSAERWGVATRHPRVLLCGSGAVRGGAVSGIGGHNAAMAVLEELAG
ncbi:NAD(P)/FAD-dependent oxidoreductase [Agromyces sp. H3Y2-19a]|uniref:phytoene desaturase family protein n=1 Tax=Agromyces chromiiresistens TaxID=3030835 RepID=UPI0023B99E08|nr:NAD(P)/FAD-dependent oxidoreductase [Agromyces chromiiresistens]MDF0513635.1 NAD(P)/FAD-dependent oxidoreductase [Agromyces chromiiresistens]